MRKIKIPSYDYIKSLSTVDPDYEDCYKDYSWVLFETVGTTGMLSYNKDDESGALLSLVWLTLWGHVGNGGAYPKLCGSLLLESIVCLF